MTETNPRTSKLYQRIQIAQADKRFYEAHQLYKTILFRCSVRKNYKEALDSLTPGAKFLLEHKQWESGSDLACSVVDLLAKSNFQLTDVHLTDLCKLLSLMPPSCVDRDKFLTKSLDLLGKNQNLLNSFNEFLGRQLWQEGSLTQARNRLMLAGNGFKVGCFLIEMHQRYGLVSEADLFITQAVLQFLCMKKATVAALTFYTYTRRHPKLELGPPFTRFPLLNFVWLLMLAIEQKLSLEVLSFLCAQYKPQLSRDPSYEEYLEKIGQVYFGVKPKGDPFSGLFSNLVRMLGDDGEDEDDGEDGQEGHSSGPAPSTTMHVDEID